MNSLPVHHTPAPTSSSSPLPDDAHPSDRTEPTRTPRQRYFDGKKLCNRIVIFAVLILVFAVCVSFAIRHWNPSKSNRRQRWERASCQMGKRPEKKQANPGIPSSFFLVTNVTLNPPIHEDKPDEQFEAFWGRDNERYNETFIDKKIETLDPDSSTRCWRTDSTPFSVSFRKIENDSTAPPATAWAAIFIAAVDAIFIITALSALFHDRGSHDQQNHTPRRNVTPPDPAKSQYLSVQQTKFVLHKFAHEASVSDLDPDWVCSICLEDDQQDDDIPIRTTILPCNHRFHRLCIKRWLRRGKAVCPLCNWDVRKLFDSDEIIIDIEAECASQNLAANDISQTDSSISSPPTTQTDHTTTTHCPTQADCSPESVIRPPDPESCPQSHPN